MVITKTPYRISFFGGGTDYPAWSRENGGAVLSTSINKYCYISARFLPAFFEHRHRFVYSLIESVREIDEIKHPAIKGVLNWMNWNAGIEVHHDGDLPARSGLGSSSAFTVGFINSLLALQNRRASKNELAKNAIHVEQNVINEAVGSQDQVAVAFGGFNTISFLKNDDFIVKPMILSPKRLALFQSSLMLFYTGESRIASSVAQSKINNIKNRRKELEAIYYSVERAISILNSEKDLMDFGYLLDEMWQIKKMLSEKVSNSLIDDIYIKAKRSGALGGKVLGAGGGGFMLFFVPQERQLNVKESLKDFLNVPFKFEYEGSSVTLYQPSDLD